MLSGPACLADPPFRRRAVSRLEDNMGLKGFKTTTLPWLPGYIVGFRCVGNPHDSPEGNARIARADDPAVEAARVAGEPGTHWGRWHC